MTRWADFKDEYPEIAGFLEGHFSQDDNHAQALHNLKRLVNETAHITEIKPPFEDKPFNDLMRDIEETVKTMQAPKMPLYMSRPVQPSDDETIPLYVASQSSNGRDWTITRVADELPVFIADMDSWNKAKIEYVLSTLQREARHWLAHSENNLPDSE